MKYLGIDYGSKRVGIAVSDGNGSMAFAKAVFPQDKMLVGTIAELCRNEEAGEIVIGESRDYKGAENPIMAKISAFKEELAVATGLPIHFELEFMTSAAAEHIQGKTDMHDASAAALILQSYLDKRK